MLASLCCPASSSVMTHQQLSWMSIRDEYAEADRGRRYPPAAKGSWGCCSRVFRMKWAASLSELGDDGSKSNSLSAGICQKRYINLESYALVLKNLVIATHWYEVMILLPTHRSWTRLSSVYQPCDWPRSSNILPRRSRLTHPLMLQRGPKCKHQYYGGGVEPTIRSGVGTKRTGREAVWYHAPLR